MGARHDLPRTMDGTYERVLLGIDEENRQYARRLFQCLTASIRPLLVEELTNIFAIWFDEAVTPVFNAAGAQITQKKR